MQFVQHVVVQWYRKEKPLGTLIRGAEKAGVIAQRIIASARRERQWFPRFRVRRGPTKSGPGAAAAFNSLNRFQERACVASREELTTSTNTLTDRNSRHCEDLSLRGKIKSPLKSYLVVQVCLCSLHYYFASSSPQLFSGISL